MKPKSGSVLLDEYLRERGLTSQAFADALGVTRVAVHYWRTGERRPEAVPREAIATITAGVVPTAAWLTEDEAASLQSLRLPEAKTETADFPESDR